MSGIRDRYVMFRCNSGRPWPYAAEFSNMKSGNSAEPVIFCVCVCVYLYVFVCVCVRGTWGPPYAVQYTNGSCHSPHKRSEVR
jgi:hypothetical protein